MPADEDDDVVLPPEANLGRGKRNRAPARSRAPQTSGMKITITLGRLSQSIRSLLRLPMS